MARKREPRISFSSKEQAAIAKEQFAQLLNHPGWKQIKAFYKRKVDLYQSELQDKVFESVDEIKRLQDKIRLCTQAMNLPDILMAQIDLSEGEERISFDPFA